jgi:hypothetical protein
MSAARADDAAGLAEATRAVRAVHESLGRYRIPESAVRTARPGPA